MQIQVDAKFDSQVLITLHLTFFPTDITVFFSFVGRTSSLAVKVALVECTSGSILSV